jgi:hypothetical protein
VRKRLITLTTAGLLAAGGAAVAVPALAATDATGTATAGSSRVDRIVEALAGLVSDGSITQKQADEVATTLDEADLGGGHGGGHGGGPGGGRDLSAAATALGMTAEELRTPCRPTAPDSAPAQGQCLAASQYRLQYSGHDLT